MDEKSRLSIRRKELGLTLEEVGKIVGVSKSTVRKWETGYIDNMKSDKIALLAKALKVSPLFVLGIEKENVVFDSPLETSEQPKTNPNIQNKLSDILSELRPDSGITLKNGEKTMTDSEKEILRISVENIIRLAKQMEK